MKPATENNSEVLTAGEAADLLRMHVDNLRTAAANGEITGRKVRGR